MRETFRSTPEGVSFLVDVVLRESVDELLDGVAETSLELFASDLNALLEVRCSFDLGHELDALQHLDLSRCSVVSFKILDVHLRVVEVVLCLSQSFLAGLSRPSHFLFFEVGFEIGWKFFEKPEMKQ